MTSSANIISIMELVCKLAFINTYTRSLQSRNLFLSFWACNAFRGWGSDTLQAIGYTWSARPSLLRLNQKVSRFAFRQASGWLSKFLVFSDHSLRTAQTLLLLGAKAWSATVVAILAHLGFHVSKLRSTRVAFLQTWHHYIFIRFGGNKVCFAAQALVRLGACAIVAGWMARFAGQSFAIFVIRWIGTWNLTNSWSVQIKLCILIHANQAFI